MNVLRVIGHALAALFTFYVEATVPPQRAGESAQEYAMRLATLHNVLGPGW